jgi:hypothetical protein
MSCSSLSAFTIPSSVERLSEACFYDCTSVVSLTFESGSHLSCLEDLVFFGCSALSSICIPASVQKVGHSCFSRCDSLSTLEVESGSKLPSLDLHGRPRDVTMVASTEPVGNTPKTSRCNL